MTAIAVIWDTEVPQDASGPAPFESGHLNRTYETFCRMAHDNDAEVYIANFQWFDAGTLKQAYTFDGDNWQRVQDVSVDVVFDKYKWADDTLEMKRWIADNLPVLNHFTLEEICKDKLLTYETFPEYVPETVEASRAAAKRFLDEDGRAVIKPCFDFGGHGVAVIDDISEYDDYEKDDDTLVQRFVDSSTGYEGLVDGVHDLRIIAVNDEPVVAFLRTPESGFISNVSQGGTLHHVPLEDVPETAMEVFEAVADEFAQYEPNMYAADMIFDADGNAHILELNSKPGMGFYDDPDIEEWKRPLMERVVETLAAMTE